MLYRQCTVTSTVPRSWSVSPFLPSSGRDSFVCVECDAQSLSRPHRARCNQPREAPAAYLCFVVLHWHLHHAQELVLEHHLVALDVQGQHLGAAVRTAQAEDEFSWVGGTPVGSHLEKPTHASATHASSQGNLYDCSHVGASVLSTVLVCSVWSSSISFTNGSLWGGVGRGQDASSRGACALCVRARTSWSCASASRPGPRRGAQ